jgi:hypothetical protein
LHRLFGTDVFYIKNSPKMHICKIHDKKGANASQFLGDKSFRCPYRGIIIKGVVLHVNVDRAKKEDAHLSVN